MRKSLTLEKGVKNSKMRELTESFHKSVCIVFNQLWLCPKTSQNQRSVILRVLVKCQFEYNRVLLVLTSMPFDGTSSGRKCYDAGRGRLSFDSFQKGLENRERTEK